MLNDEHIRLPRYYEQIAKESEKLTFTMLSDLKTGSLLRTLAASKPGGNFLELGTGTGLSLAWIAEGADAGSHILSIDNEDKFQYVARNAFEKDNRITFQCVDGNDWLHTYQGEKFDLLFADAWPGKFENLGKALELVKIGGFYIIDDLLPRPTWPETHQLKVNRLIEQLQQNTSFVGITLNWSTGLMLFTKIK